jgi:hypothetical protein
MWAGSRVGNRHAGMQAGEKEVDVWVPQPSPDWNFPRSVPGVMVGLHGPDVILEGCRVYGEGTAIASVGPLPSARVRAALFLITQTHPPILPQTPLSQDRVYFEVKLERNGQWAFGVARKAAHTKVEMPAPMPLSTHPLARPTM